MERSSYERFAGDASQRIHSIVSAAESEASGLLRDAEREADLIRREARTDADRILDDARRQADDLVAERMQRLAGLSDGIVERTAMIFDRMEAAGHVKRQLDGLLRSLGEAAEAVSRESSRRAASRPPVHTRAAAAPRPAPPAPRAADPAPMRPVAPSRAAAQDPLPPPRESVPATQVPRAEPVRSAPESARRVEDKSDARFDGARLVALQMAVAGSMREEVHEELQRAFRLEDPSPILDDVFGERRAGAAS